MSTLLLDKLLDPSSVAIIGASARVDSPGHQVTRNVLLGGYEGELYLVNPRYQRVLDVECHKSIKSLPATPDLALILTPAALLKRTLKQCSRKGIRIVIVMSGTQCSQELHDHAQHLGMRLMGPYCAGLIRPHLKLNATFSENAIKEGNLAIISQSASLGAATVDWAERNNVGFSALLSTGQNAEISLADLLDLLADDRHTRAIIVYVDHIKASRGFLSALSAAARIKPVVLMRSTQSGISYCDAMTRSGEVISTDDVFQSALNRAGVVRIRTFENLFAAAKILSSGVRIAGKRIAILSNGNAPAMIALERLHLKQFETPPIDEKIINLLQQKKSVSLTGINPLLLRGAEDLTMDFQASVRLLLKSDMIDAVLVIFVPDSRNNPTAIADAVIACHDVKKPLITCWMGDTTVLEAREALSRHAIPTFRTPEGATDALDFLQRYLSSQQLLLQLPNPASRKSRVNTNAARAFVRDELQSAKRVLGPISTRTLMQLCDIPVLESIRATHIDEALVAANSVGYPVAMKLVSPNISFKSSVMPAQLNVSCDNEVIETWHLIVDNLKRCRPNAVFRGVLIETMYLPGNQRQLALSVSRDPVFGPVISISIGGELTALLHQRIVQLPPLNSFLIDDMLSSRNLQIYMGAFRHTPAIDSSPIGQVLRRLSEMACELPDVFSVDINPLVVTEQGAVAMDVQVVLERSPPQKRYQHLAIHPYPWEWVRNTVGKDGSALQLRPIRPSDAVALKTLVSEMSPESRYFRFMHAINELTPLMVAQFTKLDYDRQMAFVATPSPVNRNSIPLEKLVLFGVSRYTISSNRRIGEFAVSVSDDSKGKGIATALMKLLIEHATEQGLEMLQGDVLRNNTAMRGLMRSLGFISKTHADDPEILLYSFKLTGSDES